MELLSPRWPPLGGRRQRLKYAPIAYVTGAPAVPELAGKRFYHYKFPQLSLAGLQTLETMVITDRPFWAVCFLAQTSLVPDASSSTFRLQLLDPGIRYDRMDRHFFQKKALEELLACAQGAGPSFKIVPHYVPASHTIQLRVTNTSANANVVDVSLFGYVNAPPMGWQVDDAGLITHPAVNRDLPPNLPLARKQGSQ